MVDTIYFPLMGTFYVYKIDVYVHFCVYVREGRKGFIMLSDSWICLNK